MNKEQLLSLPEKDFSFEKDLDHKRDRDRETLKNRFEFIRDTFKTFDELYSGIYKYSTYVVETESSFKVFLNGDELTTERNGWEKDVWKKIPIIDVHYANSNGLKFMQAVSGGNVDFNEFWLDYESKFAGFNGSDLYCYNKIALSNHINIGLLRAIKEMTTNNISKDEYEKLVNLTIEMIKQ